MNRQSIVYEKILFVKEYWKYLLAGNVDIFDKTYIVDLKTILIDIYTTIDYVKDNYPNKRNIINYGDLPYICKELLSFMEKSYYLKSDISYELQQIKTNIVMNNCFENIMKADKNRIQNIFSTIQCDIKSCENKLKANKEYFYNILKDLKSVCFGSHKLKVVIQNIKFLLTEAVFAGYDKEMSHEFLMKFFNFIDEARPKTCNLKLFINHVNKPESKKIIYFFSIRNLKKLFPERIGEIILYNPMRRDLLIHIEKEKWYEEDYWLMTRREREFFDRNDKCGWTEDEYNNILLSTDCHARITIEALDIFEGVDRAKKKVEEAITTIKYLCLKNNLDINLNTSYAAIEINSGHSKYPLGLYENTNVPDYYVRGFDDDLRSRIRDEGSTFNRVMILSKKEILFKSLRWFNDAGKQSESHMRYLGYFICIETLLTASYEYEKIKERLLKIVPNIIIINVFANELIFIYRYVSGMFGVLGKYKEVPQEIKSINGLEDFMVKINLQTFRDNLTIFYKYSNSPYINDLIRKYLKAYKNINFRNKLVKDLRIKLKYILARNYRLRNNIVHSGDITKFFIDLNISFLKDTASILISSAISGINKGDMDEDIVTKISSTQIQKNFSDWYNSFI